MSKADYLVVDTGGFIKNAPLRELGHNIITLREVVDEIRDKPTRQRLQVLPYELDFRTPSPEGIRAVSEFARKTGDFASLSAVDVMVLAVTYDLEVEKCGTQHLNKEPKVKKSVEFYHPNQGISDGDKKIAGFFTPDGDQSHTTGKDVEEENFSSFQFWREPIPEIPLDLDLDLSDSLAAMPETSAATEICPLSSEELENLDSYLTERSFICDYEVSPVDKCVVEIVNSQTASKYNNIQRWFNHVNSYSNVQKNPKLSLEQIFSKIADGFDFSMEDVLENSAESGDSNQVSSDEGVGLLDSDRENADDEYEEGDELDDDDDDEGWITPSNIKQKKDLMAGKTSQDERVTVACLTTDFAMQNVLKQLGLNILGTNGMLIKETKTWILRCYACFRTTPLLDRKFCPKCGNKTLKRVSVTLNSDGTQQIHISTRRALTSRGKKYSLPAPIGGKHGVNPRLFEDQPEAQQRLSKKAKQKNNPMDPDWIAGSSPFQDKDVTSKSAMLGLRGQGRGQAQPSGKYWSQKNPNAGRKATGNKRKK